MNVGHLLRKTDHRWQHLPIATILITFASGEFFEIRNKILQALNPWPFLFYYYRAV